MNEDEIRKLFEGVGGEVTEFSALPNGEDCFATASFPLPKDHLLTVKGSNTPPMVMRMGAGPERDEMVQKIWAAGKYAVRAATMNGREDDFDPDALCQNLVVGMLGYFTADGLSHDLPDDDPCPVPPLFFPKWATEEQKETKP